MTKQKGINEGRPRTTAAEKRKKGSLNRTREKAREAAEMKVVKINEYPTPPAGLGPEGKAHWEVVVRELTDLRLLSKIDLFNLRALCIEWECYIEHRAEQRKVKSYYGIKGDDGKVKSWQPRPVHYNGTNHLREYLRLCNEFGLSPAARARIGISAQETVKSKAASLLKKAV